MKVLFVNDAPLIKYGLARGFEKAKADVKILPLWRFDPGRQEQELSHAAEEFKPDMVIAEGHSGLDQPSFFQCVKKLNLNLIYWAIEDPPHIDWISMPYARESKFVFTTAVECVERYRNEGIPAETLLFACEPDYHHRMMPTDAYKHDIVFVGSNYDIRYDAARTMVLPLIERGYDIMVWGLWWDDRSRPVQIPQEHYGGLMPYEDLAKVYSSAKIVLGLHCDDSSITQTSMRTYEALGCGAFYLTQYTKAHEHLFSHRKHLSWSHSPEETVESVDYYLQHEEERKEIAQEGQAFVYANHTYEQRAQQVLRVAEKYLD